MYPSFFLSNSTCSLWVSLSTVVQAARMNDHNASPLGMRALTLNAKAEVGQTESPYNLGLCQRSRQWWPFGSFAGGQAPDLVPLCVSSPRCKLQRLSVCYDSSRSYVINMPVIALSALYLFIPCILGMRKQLHDVRDWPWVTQVACVDWASNPLSQALKPLGLVGSVIPWFTWGILASGSELARWPVLDH